MLRMRAESVMRRTRHSQRGAWIAAVSPLVLVVAVLAYSYFAPDPVVIRQTTPPSVVVLKDGMIVWIEGDYESVVFLSRLIDHRTPGPAEKMLMQATFNVTRRYSFRDGRATFFDHRALGLAPAGAKEIAGFAVHAASSVGATTPLGLWGSFRYAYPPCRPVNIFAISIGRSLALVGLPLFILLVRSSVRHLRVCVRRGRGACIRCGYDLRGNTTGICPECGQLIFGADYY